MTRALRRGSLFWTIAGVFLLTVVLGSLAQWLVATAVLRPLESREARTRAELLVSAVATEISALPVPPGRPEIGALLARHRGELGVRPAWVVFRSPEGGIITDPPRRARQIAALLMGEAPPALSPEARPAPSPGSPPEGFRRASIRFRPEFLARRAVTWGGEAIGEVLVVRPAPPPGMPGIPGSRTSLLFLPIALLASALAGLIMVRILVRRLRALETLAARVAEGDLSVRIADPSGDEIGRLAERLDRMTERLAEARTRVEEAGAQRRQLFADITHELATPLTSIRGYAETLLDPGVPISQEERARYIRGVLEESRRLDRLISDLFELARLEAGASPLALEPIDLVGLCRNTLDRFEPRFREAGLRLDWRPTVGVAIIQADGHRMEQVLENLLVNALRYVPSGGTVEVALGRADGSPGRVRLAVSDDGPGIASADLARVFERFYRAAGTREGDAGGRGARDAGGPGGSGLGLAIVREVVERHGGTARAEARAPHGLSIVIEIPIGAAPAPTS